MVVPSEELRGHHGLPNWAICVRSRHNKRSILWGAESATCLDTSVGLWICDPLALSRGGFARESAAVARCGCSGSRTACGLPRACPAKLAARVRVYSRGHGRKTHKDDAVSIGLAALDGTGVTPVTCDDVLVSLRLLGDRREELTALRTQAVCRLHRLLAELTQGGMRRELTANKAQALLARIRPADDVGRVRVHIARDHLADIRALDARLKFLAGQITTLVTASGTSLTTLFGIGPVIAGRLLAETGDVTRFATKDHFASYNGSNPTGPIPLPARRPQPPLDAGAQPASRPGRRPARRAALTPASTGTHSHGGRAGTRLTERSRYGSPSTGHGHALSAALCG